MESVMTFLIVLLAYLGAIAWCVDAATSKGYNPKVAFIFAVFLPVLALIVYWALRPTRDRR